MLSLFCTEPARTHEFNIALRSDIVAFVRRRRYFRCRFSSKMFCVRLFAINANCPDVQPFSFKHSSESCDLSGRFLLLISSFDFARLSTSSMPFTNKKLESNE